MPDTTDTWTVRGSDTERGIHGDVLVTVTATRGMALARGCEAIAHGWTDVKVEGHFTRRTYALVNA